MRGARTLTGFVAAAMLMAAPVARLGAQEQPLRIEMFGPHFRIIQAVPAQPVAGVYANSVTADVVIAVDGSVESVKVMTGHKAHHASAVAALKQYRFAPVVLNGKPTRAILQMRVTVPDTLAGGALTPPPDSATSVTVGPRRDVTLTQDCARTISQMKAEPGAIATCRNAVDAVDRASPTTPADRRTVRGWLGDAYLLARQWSDAIAAYDAALGVAAPAANDIETGELLAKAAVAHMELDDLDAADRRVAAAVAKIEGFKPSSPEQRRARAGALEAIYLLGAKVKRLRGDVPAAEAFERKAAALSVSL